MYTIIFNNKLYTIGLKKTKWHLKKNETISFSKSKNFRTTNKGSYKKSLKMRDFFKNNQKLFYKINDCLKRCFMNNGKIGKSLSIDLHVLLSKGVNKG